MQFQLLMLSVAVHGGSQDYGMSFATGGSFVQKLRNQLSSSIMSRLWQRKRGRMPQPWPPDG